MDIGDGEKRGTGILNLIAEDLRRDRQFSHAVLDGDFPDTGHRDDAGRSCASRNNP